MKDLSIDSLTLIKLQETNGLQSAETISQQAKKNWENLKGIPGIKWVLKRKESGTDKFGDNYTIPADRILEAFDKLGIL